MADKDAINSALLTSSIKSVKLLTAMSKKQQALFDLLTEIKTQQASDSQLLQVLQDMPTKEDILDITRGVVELNDQVKQGFTNLSSQLDDSSSKLNQAIEQTDNTQALNVIKKLIESVKTLGNNVVTLSGRVETLSSNVNTIHGDTKALSSTIIESNTRVKSMDMRMGALIDQSMDNESIDDNSMDDDLKFLESLPNEGDAKVDEEELAQRKRERQAKLDEGKAKRDDVKHEQDKEDFNTMLNELETSMSQLPDLTAKSDETKSED